MVAAPLPTNGDVDEFALDMISIAPSFLSLSLLLLVSLLSLSANCELLVQPSGDDMLD